MDKSSREIRLSIMNYQKIRLLQFSQCSKRKKIIIGANSVLSVITHVFCYL